MNDSFAHTTTRSSEPKCGLVSFCMKYPKSRINCKCAQSGAWMELSLARGRGLRRAAQLLLLLLALPLASPSPASRPLIYFHDSFWGRDFVHRNYSFEVRRRQGASPQRLLLLP